MSAEFINLIVATTGGDLEDRFNLNQPVRVLFNRALALVGGGADKGSYTLENDGTELDLDHRIGDYVNELGWTDGIRLDLVPAPVVI